MRLLTGSSEGQLLDHARPLVAAAADVGEAHTIAAHLHPRGQLLYAVSGAMQITCGPKRWHVTPRHAIWVPPGIIHEVIARNALSYRSLYVDPAAIHNLPSNVTALEIRPLVRELIVEASGFGGNYRPDSAEARLISVLHDQLIRLPGAVLPVSIPRDRRLGGLVDKLLSDPASDRSLDDWATTIGASSRTIARLFQKETGETFTHWRQRLRLSHALDRLLAGDSITSIALDLGYDSPSAFTAMFRRTLGLPPSVYLKRYQ